MNLHGARRAVAAARDHHDHLIHSCPWVRAACEYHHDESWAAVDGDEEICLTCERDRIERMADAASDVRGWAAWEAQRAH